MRLADTPKGRDKIQQRLDAVGLWLAIESVAREHNVDARAIISRRRHASVALARHHVWAVIRWTVGLSLTEIAILFDVNHTTVLDGVRRWERKIQEVA